MLSQMYINHKVHMKHSKQVLMTDSEQPKIINQNNKDLNKHVSKLNLFITSSILIFKNVNIKIES